MDVLTNYYFPKMRYKYTLGGTAEDAVAVYQLVKKRLPENVRRTLEESEADILREIAKEKAKETTGGVFDFVSQNPMWGIAIAVGVTYFLLKRK